MLFAAAGRCVGLFLVIWCFGCCWFLLVVVGCLSLLGLVGYYLLVLATAGGLLVVVDSCWLVVVGLCRRGLVDVGRCWLILVVLVVVSWLWFLVSIVVACC